MIFFTSDQHFGHANIIKYCNRPFVDVDEMNNVMIDRWNAVVGSQDTTYVVGDFAMGKIADTLPIVGLLNGEKILIVGNHDRPFLETPIERHVSFTQKQLRGQAQATQRYIDAGFSNIIHGGPMVQVGDYKLHLNHFPYFDPTSVDQRFSHMRPIDHGQPLIHGHIHDEYKIGRGPNGGLSINVGVDAWDFTPVSVNEILEIVRSG